MSDTPNILFIFSDQHRYDCIGYNHLVNVHTPNIDRIAREGISFDRAFTPIPLCCPARQSLITIRRPERFEAYWNFDITLPVSSLSPKDYSWVRALKERSYQNAYVGKWHVSPDYSPLDYGFDTYIPDNEYDAYLKSLHPEYQKELNWFGSVESLKKEETHTHFLADKAIQQIKTMQNRNTPWHLRLDYIEPHPPYYVCEEFASLYDPDTLPPWESFTDNFTDKPYIQKQNLINWNIENYTWKDWAKPLARYLALITQMDDAIGNILNYLEQEGILDNTIVIYSTDHGDMVGSHRMMDKHYVLYDDLIHVPLVIRYPKLIKPQSRSNAHVYNTLDLPLALLELLNLEAPSCHDGTSLYPLLKGSVPPDWRTSIMSSYNGQHFGLYTQRCLRNERYKYVWNTCDVDELYDLQSDPSELHNLVHKTEYAPVLAQLRTELYQSCIQACDPLLTKAPWLHNQLLHGRKL